VSRGRLPMHGSTDAPSCFPPPEDVWRVPHTHVCRIGEVSLSHDSSTSDGRPVRSSGAIARFASDACHRVGSIARNRGGSEKSDPSTRYALTQDAVPSIRAVCDRNTTSSCADDGGLTDSVVSLATHLSDGVFMSDPRNVAHAKKVTQEKKHHGTGASPEDAPAVRPGKKPSVAKNKKTDVARPVVVSNETAAGEIAVPSEGSTVKTPAALEGSLVLAKLKELEFHSRANLERLAELALTVEDELKQKELLSPLAEVYSAQSAFQTKLTALLEANKAECDRMQGERL
jgi:hypothetical protein